MDQQGPTYAHHPRFSEGMGTKASDYLAVPLCYEHHQGKTGIHGDRSAWNIAKINEPQALGLTIRKLMRTPHDGDAY